MIEKLYAQRDIEQLDEDGSYVFNHVMASTGEDLHSKAAIAAELGYRAAEIARLTAELARLNSAINAGKI